MHERRLVLEMVIAMSFLYGALADRRAVHRFRPV
jgi:hypothetical protein